MVTFNVWSSPAEEMDEHRIPILDFAEDLFGHRANNIANDFDSFFATDRADDELGRSRLRVRTSRSVNEGAKMADDTRFSFNLRLPSLEQKFRKMVESKKKKTDESRVEHIRRLKTLEEVNKLDKKWLFRGNLSTNVSIHPSVTLRARLRKSAQTGTLIHRFVQEATWISYRDGFRQRTSLSTDQSISDDLLFRFNNTVDWRISQKTFNTVHGPSLLHRLSDDEAMSYNFSGSTIVDGGLLYFNGWQLGTNYRLNIYHQVFYMDLGTGLNFPKSESFRRSPYAMIQFEALFGS